MLITILHLAASAPPAPAIFDQSIAAQRARKKFNVAVELDTLLDGRTKQVRYELAYQAPNKVLMKRMSGSRPNLILWLSAGKFLAYDPVSKEFVQRKAPTVGPVVNRLANALGGLEDVLSAQLSPETMAAFFEPFKKLEGWQTTRTANTISLVRLAKVNGKQTKSRFTFSASSKLLTEALLQGGQGTLRWSYRYLPTPPVLTFSPAPGSKLVKSLTERTGVTKSDPQAKAVVEACVRAYNGLLRAEFTVSGAGGESHVWIDGDNFRERQPKLEWAYYQGVLTIRRFADGAVFQGRTKQSSIIDYLRKLRSPMQPMLQAIVSNKNPISPWLAAGLTIRSKGVVNLGVPADAVEMTSPFLEIAVLIRRDNRLVSSVGSRTLDGYGNLLSAVDREYTYKSVNRPLPGAAFKIEAKAAKPLSAIK